MAILKGELGMDYVTPPSPWGTLSLPTEEFEELLFSEIFKCVKLAAWLGLNK